VPPTVVSTTPAASATNVSVHTPVVAVFDEPMLVSSITSSTFLLKEQQSGEPVPGHVSVTSGATATFTAANSLKYATDYCDGGHRYAQVSRAEQSMHGDL
jgi:hypothetical protein